MTDIVISEFMDEDAVAGLTRDFEVHYDPGLVDRPGDLVSALADARALIVRNRTQVRGALLDAAPGLKVIGRLGVGLDNIDLAACDRRGIAVRPASHANDLAVAEYVIAMALVLLRGGYMATGDVIAGDWPRPRCIGRETAGKLIGFVGFGGIGRETARLARCLGMSVAAHDPFLDDDDPALEDVRPMDLDGLLAAADVISLHVPLNDGTRGLIGAGALSKMRPGAVLINTARGGVVDEAALCAALASGRLGGAAIDIFAGEPVDAAGGALFRGVPNLILTPHIAGVTEESNVRVSAATADNVRAALKNS